MNKEEFLLLQKQLIWTHTKFSILFHLYLKDDRARYFSETLPSIFGLLQQSLLNETILDICKLTDPARNNFSLKRLSKQLKTRNTKLQNLGLKLEKRIEQKDVKNIRKHRHKRISHYDYEVFMSSAKLPKLKIKQINNILTDLMIILDKIALELFGGEIFYTNEMQAAWEADFLFAALKAGRKNAEKKVSFRRYKTIFRNELSRHLSRF